MHQCKMLQRTPGLMTVVHGVTLLLLLTGVLMLSQHLLSTSLLSLPPPVLPSPAPGSQAVFSG